MPGLIANDYTAIDINGTYVAQLLAVHILSERMNLRLRFYFSLLIVSFIAVIHRASETYLIYFAPLPLVVMASYFIHVLLCFILIGFLTLIGVYSLISDVH